MLDNLQGKHLRAAAQIDQEIIEYLKEQSTRLSKNVKLIEDVAVRWNQGAIQVLDELIIKLKTSGDILEKEVASNRAKGKTDYQELP